VKKLLFAVAVVAAAAFPTSAFAGTFSGVVVGNSGGNLAVASKSGAVRTVHTRAHLRLGTRVHVNGTSVRASGVAHRARVHGVVVGRSHGVTFVAAGHSLLAVRAHSGRRLASASAASGPATGSVVNSTVAIGNGQLTQQSMQVVGTAGSVTIQAPVTAVGPGTITVTINGQSLVIPLPAGIQLPASLVGQNVTLNVTLSVSGATAQADDDDQGEDNDDQGDDDGGGGDD
jgi:hypothetical protein